MIRREQIIFFFLIVLIKGTVPVKCMTVIVHPLWTYKLITSANLTGIAASNEVCHSLSNLLSEIC